MERTTVTTLGPGSVPVVRHVAGPGPGADRLRREAELLALARGPGVVDLVEAGVADDGEAFLATRYLAGGTLADVVVDLGEVAATAVLASAAATLADLHERGISHGRCTAEHVVGGPATTALCGFGAARATVLDGSISTRADREAIAALVAATLTSGSTTASRARRATAGLVGPSPTTNLRAVAAELRALALDAGWRPPAQATATRPDPHRSAVGGAGPTEHRDGTDGGRRETGPAPRLAAARAAVDRRADGGGRRLAAALGGGTAVAAVLVALVLALPVGGSPDAAPAAAGDGPEPQLRTTDDPPPPGAGREVLDAAGAPRSRPVRVWPAPLPAEPPSAAPTDPAVAARTGGDPAVVEHDGVRFRIGAPGDIVVVGDWDCDGGSTPTVVRPGDGSVWAFRAWATGGEELVAEALGYAASPVAASAVPADDGCDALSIRTADGRDVLIDPA